MIMSGKNKKQKSRTALGVLILGILLTAVVVCIAAALKIEGQNTAVGTENTEVRAESNVETGGDSVQIDAVEEVSVDLGQGLVMTDIGSYTGVYMEDGSDDLVSGILLIAVANRGDHAVQYAEIAMPAGDGTAVFSLSTLPPGETVILLEKNRMEYTAAEYTAAAAENVVLFTEPLSQCADKLSVQILNGAINVTNISGGDITADIVIYYKNSAADVYYGGITYRVRLEGGLKAGELRQIMASHFSADGSAIMFVTCGES